MHIFLNGYFMEFSHFYIAALGASIISVGYSAISYFGRDIRVKAEDPKTKFYISMMNVWLNAAMFVGVPILLPGSIVPLIPYVLNCYNSPITSVPFTSI